MSEPAVCNVVAKAIAAMRQAENELGKLLALRNGAEAIESIRDRKALETLSAHAVDVEHLDTNAVKAAIEQGCEIAALDRSHPTSESG